MKLVNDFINTNYYLVECLLFGSGTDKPCKVRTSHDTFQLCPSLQVTGCRKRKHGVIINTNESRTDKLLFYHDKVKSNRSLYTTCI